MRMKMKRVFRRNQIIITTLAIMIAAAGYLNYAGKSDLPGADTYEAGATKISDSDIYSENQAVSGSVADGEYEEIASLMFFFRIVDLYDIIVRCVHRAARRRGAGSVVRRQNFHIARYGQVPVLKAQDTRFRTGSFRLSSRREIVFSASRRHEKTAERQEQIFGKSLHRICF